MRQDSRLASAGSTGNVQTGSLILVQARGQIVVDLLVLRLTTQQRFGQSRMQRLLSTLVA